MTCGMQGHRTVTVIISLNEGEQKGISFELSKTHLGTVFGYVYDEDENPLKSVTVTIAGNGYSDSVNTDEDGYYEFDDVSAGDYTVTYTKTGYETQTQDVTIEEGEDVHLSRLPCRQFRRVRYTGM